MRQTFNIFGTAFAGVQPLAQSPPALVLAGAVPSLFPNRSKMPQDDLAGLTIPPGGFSPQRPPFPQRGNAIGFLARLFLVTGFAFLAGVVLEGCEWIEDEPAFEARHIHGGAR